MIPPGKHLWRLTLALLLAGNACGRGHESGDRSNVFRIAFSSRVTAKLNENDAKAAVKVWADSLIKERGIQGTAVTSILPPAEVIRALNAGELDGAALTTPEMLTVEEGKISHLLIPSHGGDIHHEYVLLARRDNGIQGPADLRGKRLLWLDDYRASLARPWLDVALARDRLPPADQLLGSISAKDKPSQVVLPVFFRSADACLINRHLFETMTELNPQVGQQLRVLASSPKLVTGVCCIAASYQSPVKPQILDALLHMPDSVAGRQILTVFQFGELVERPPSCLQSARDLLLEYARLVANPVAPPSQTGPAPPP